MAKIVIDARELRTSTGRYVERLLFYLQRIDTVNTYIALLKPEDLAGWQPTNPNFTATACPYKEFSFAEQVAFRKQISDLKADLVHFPMAQQPVLYKGSVVTTIQDLTTIRFTNPSKNLLVFRFKQQIYKWLIKQVARKSLALLTPTEFVKQDVLSFTKVPAEKITVTLEAADIIAENPEPIPGLEQQDFIMYVGRPTPHKNLPRLIEAFAKLQPTHPTLQLVLAGKKDTNYAKIAKNIQDMGIKQVVFTGHISDGQLRWLYEHCAAYVFPSLSEGFGLPGLEAMAHGAPVISSNATCLPEVNGNAAHYFDPFDVADIAQKITDVLDNNELRQQLIVKGKQQVGTYSWERMPKQTLAVYTKVLQANH